MNHHKRVILDQIQQIPVNGHFLDDDVSMVRNNNPKQNEQS